MSGDPYRSPERAPTQGRVEAEERIGASEEKLGPLALLFVPEDLRARIARLRGLGDDASDDDVREELAEALEDALATAEQRVADLEHLPDEHPEGPTLLDSWGLIGTEKAAATAVMAVEAAVGEVDRDGEVTLTGPRITARFRVGGTPVLWSVHLGGEIVAPGRSVEVHAFSTSSHWMGTSVPNDIPRVFLRREGIADKVLKALHLRPEVEVEDPSFDATFFVEVGDKDLLRALLTPRLKDALLARARLGDFTFLLRSADASLAWKTSFPWNLPSADACAAGGEILDALREALGLLQLVRAT